MGKQKNFVFGVLFSLTLVFTTGLLLLSGCVAATSHNNQDPYLRPIVVAGEYSQLFSLARKVALNTFPDGEMSSDAEDGTIRIARYNFLRGDTLINITFMKEYEGSFSVNAVSRGFGSNPPIVDWSTGEVKKFMKEYKKAYRRYVQNYVSSAAGHDTEMEAIPSKDTKISSKYDGFLQAVVTIRSSKGVGSGFFVSNDGYIVTNKHLFSSFDNQVSIMTYDGRNLIGAIVEKANDRDLALIKVQRNDCSWLQLADRNQYRVGMEVIAIGMPKGYDWSVSKGIISAVRTIEGVSCIQTDAAINSGNSGGPLISLESGEVVGVNTFVFRKDLAEGLNFAISSIEISGVFKALAPSSN